MSQQHVISAYSMQQAIADGVLTMVGATKGRAIVATSEITEDLPMGEQVELFGRFFIWQREVAPTLPEDDRMFVATANNGRTVWVDRKSGV